MGTPKTIPGKQLGPLAGDVSGGGSATQVQGLGTSGASVTTTGSAPPTAGQALIALTSTTAGWANNDLQAIIDAGSTPGVYVGGTTVSITNNVANSPALIAISAGSGATFRATQNGSGAAAHFDGPVEVAGVLKLMGSSSGFVGFQPHAAAGSTTYTFPATPTNGNFLQTDGSGTLTWASAGAGSATLQSAYDSTSGNIIAVASSKGLAFSNGADTTNLLTLTRTFAGVGNALTISMSNGSIGNAINVDGGTQTANSPFFKAVQTWNNSGVAFSGFAADITKTAANTNSRLINFRADVGSGLANAFSVDPSGVVELASGGGVTGPGGVIAGAGLGVTTTDVFVFNTGGGGAVAGIQVGSGFIDFSTQGNSHIRLTQFGDVILNNSGSAIANGALHGFAYLTSTAGNPSGTPATLVANESSVPTIIDSTNALLWAYYGGQWNQIGTGGGGGVTSLAGTSNQITASASTGAVTLSMPNTVVITTSMTAGGTAVDATGINRTTGGTAAIFNDNNTTSAGIGTGSAFTGLTVGGGASYTGSIFGKSGVTETFPGDILIQQTLTTNGGVQRSTSGTAAIYNDNNTTSASLGTGSAFTGLTIGGGAGYTGSTFGKSTLIDTFVGHLQINGNINATGGVIQRTSGGTAAIFNDNNTTSASLGTGSAFTGLTVGGGAGYTGSTFGKSTVTDAFLGHTSTAGTSTHTGIINANGGVQRSTGGTAALFTDNNTTSAAIGGGSSYTGTTYGKSGVTETFPGDILIQQTLKGSTSAALAIVSQNNQNITLSPNGTGTTQATGTSTNTSQAFKVLHSGTGAALISAFTPAASTTSGTFDVISTSGSTFADGGGGGTTSAVYRGLVSKFTVNDTATTRNGHYEGIAVEVTETSIGTGGHRLLKLSSSPSGTFNAGAVQFHIDHFGGLGFQVTGHSSANTGSPGSPGSITGQAAFLKITDVNDLSSLYIPLFA